MNNVAQINLRVVSKRSENGATRAVPGETIIDVDRSNPVLGNRHVLHNHRDDVERNAVIEAHARDFTADVAINRPMSRAIDDIVIRLKAGEHIALRCWCAPRRCHAETYAGEIRRRFTATAIAAPSEHDAEI